MIDRQFDVKEQTISQLARQPADAQQTQANASAATGHPLLHLQRIRGNRFVQRMIIMLQVAHDPTEAPEGIEQAIQRRRGGGQSLDHTVRAQMETSMNADFSKVGVHTGAEADSLNRALNARAFTTGHEIFFRQGAYDPGSSNGRELLAHELTHVVQQGGAVRRKLTVGQPGDQYEQEADAVARAVMQQEAQGSVRRQPEEEKEEEPGHKGAEAGSLQRQAEEEKQETVQAHSEPGAILRQEEQEEEPVQMQSIGEAALGQTEQEEPEEQA